LLVVFSDLLVPLQEKMGVKEGFNDWPRRLDPMLIHLRVKFLASTFGHDFWKPRGSWADEGPNFAAF
jgi:hypothetical protein